MSAGKSLSFLMMLTLSLGVACGREPSPDLRETEALAASLPSIDGVVQVSSTPYTFCSQESCPPGHQRHALTIVFDAAAALTLDEIADEYQGVLQGWTRSDFTDCGLDASPCANPVRQYVSFRSATGRLHVEFGSCNGGCPGGRNDGVRTLQVSVDHDVNR